MFSLAGKSGKMLTKVIFILSLNGKIADQRYITPYGETIHVLETVLSFSIYLSFIEKRVLL